MGYKLYKDQFDVFGSTSAGKRTLKSVFKKVKNPPYSLFAEFAKPSVLASGDSTSLCLLSEESAWHDDGCPTIFFENESLVNSLCLAEFDFENDFNVEPPFKAFAMAFPSNTVVEGVELVSCLVTIMTRDEFFKLYADKVPEMPVHLKPGDYTGKELCVAVNFMEKNGLYSDRDFSHINEFTTNLKKNNAQKPLGKATETLSTLSKLALAMCVYNSANDGKKLVKGFPDSSVSIPSGKTKVAYKGLVMGSGEEHSAPDNTEGRKIKYRVPHYRNLKADRYYQNEHSHKEKGSRWILIKAYDPEEIAHTLKG